MNRAIVIWSEPEEEAQERAICYEGGLIFITNGHKVKQVMGLKPQSIAKALPDPMVMRRKIKRELLQPSIPVQVIAMPTQCGWCVAGIETETHSPCGNCDGTGFINEDDKLDIPF